MNSFIFGARLRYVLISIFCFPLFLELVTYIHTAPRGVTKIVIFYRIKSTVHGYYVWNMVPCMESVCGLEFCVLIPGVEYDSEHGFHVWMMRFCAWIPGVEYGSVDGFHVWILRFCTWIPGMD